MATLILWCEIERAQRQLLPLLEGREEPVILCASVAEAVDALLDYPEAPLMLASFVGVPLAHAQAACRRFRSEIAGRRLRLLGVLEIGQLAEYDPMWGLDDFILFPVDAQELAARLTMILWRDRDLGAGSLFKLESLVIDRDRHEVLVDSVPISLTMKEYELLLLLVTSGDRVLTREAILESVWGSDYYGGERTVDVHIRRLRAKLEDVGVCIETVHGLGYRFSPKLLGG